MEIGFTERFLRTPAGSHPSLRNAIAAHPKAWRTCPACKAKYCDVSKLANPIINSKGNDLRKTVSAAQRAGFCCIDCVSDHYSVTQDDASRIIASVLIALRPDFYELKQWRELRYQVLAKRGGKCECCGRSSKDGVVLHVDHIKPRKRFPHLALSFDNLQVLCADCNLGKGASDSTDWRGAA